MPSSSPSRAEVIASATILSTPGIIWSTAEGGFDARTGQPDVAFIVSFVGWLLYLFVVPFFVVGALGLITRLLARGGAEMPPAPGEGRI